MADPKTTAAKTAAAEELEKSAAPAEGVVPRASRWTRLFVLLFMIGVIGTECVVAYFYLQNDLSVMRTATIKEEAKDGEEGENGQPGETVPKNQRVEVDLGDFGITVSQSTTNTTLRVDFHLYGTILKDEEALFLERYEQNKFRIRDHVISTIRSSAIEDFADPTLGLIKRKILAKTNETLGKTLLLEVIFSEYSNIEQ